MPTVKLVDFSGNEIGKTDLPASHFGIEPNSQVVSEYVRMYLANQRKGTANTKNRALVAGGGAKPYRQKGTGRARQGSIRAPQFTGGGVVFGPTPRSYYYQIPRKKKQLALKSVLSDRVRNEKCLVVDELKMADYKTREIASFVTGLALNARKYLLVLNKHDKNILRCVQNIKNVDVKLWDDLNAYDLLRNEVIILEKSIIDNFKKE